MVKHSETLRGSTVALDMLKEAAKFDVDQKPRMATWLKEEVAPIESRLMVKAASRAARSKGAYSVLLRSVRVLNNKSLFGTSNVIIYAVVFDGYPDMKSGKPFWAQQFAFFDVADGAVLESIDPELGVALYRGRPRDFLNLYLMAVRDKQATRDLSEVLKENLVAQGLGTIAGAAISTYAGLPPGVTVAMARELCEKAVKTSLDFFARQKNPVIGVYYASLLEGQSFGKGMHPQDYPPGLVPCGDALEIAYEVRPDEE